MRCILWVHTGNLPVLKAEEYLRKMGSLFREIDGAAGKAFLEPDDRLLVMPAGDGPSRFERVPD